MELSQKLKKLRQARGFSQTKLAEISGVSQSFIAYLEAGTKQPTVRILRKLAAALNVPASVLLEDNDSN
ncbi:helix-turn-helix domain-containing protein [Desulfofundulus thermosubterraneus]|uniref:Helix-turn-helix n=1 Tax=Desulfofundulus thermosubterraneus DSM 16057 TaxID=1121432 RepID=A0A1M6L0E2_9FIRM|nr:helix-turn-helix transcriptional regulator [Desulfofundulus thermosubterraneus]SHJ64647.1 Helix-turn-helix [Desulfofundulus thermosubterraneus DSM 16057]